jgi:threonine/homoserine/homoserine lactone efflux protein
VRVTRGLLSGLVAGYGVGLPIGAVAIYLVSLTSRSSMRVGLAAALGVATADACYALLAVLGGTALAGPARSVAGPLKIAAAIVLFGLALRLALGAVLSWRRPAAQLDRAAPSSPLRGFLSLLGITLVNPTTVVYFIALVAGRGGASLSVAARAGFVAGVLVASASCQLAFAGSGALLGRALTTPRAQLLTSLVSSAVVAALAARIVVS